MKMMKYINLFEAFKSDKLSKTLGFIKDKEKFMNIIKMIANYNQFPISELSDDMFEYLPFASALKVKKEQEVGGDKVCDGESEWIPGEKCHHGTVKRTWGKGFRNWELIIVSNHLYNIHKLLLI